MPQTNNNAILTSECLQETIKLAELFNIFNVNQPYANPNNSNNSGSSNNNPAVSHNSTPSQDSGKKYVFNSNMQTAQTLSQTGWEIYALGDNSNLSLSLNNGDLLVTEISSGDIISGGTPTDTVASIYNINDISLVADTEYYFEITLNSSEKRTLTAYLLEPGGGWNVVASMQTIAVQEGEQTLSTKFTPNANVTCQMYISFATDWNTTYNNTTVSISNACVYSQPVTSNNSNSNSSSSSSSHSTSSNNNSSVTANEIIAYAKTFLGDPYVWGGTSPNGFDCSGFVQYVFKHFGIYLERTTYQQVTQGTAVALNDMQPGDLVFEIGSATAPDHVGIYLGNNQIINAEDPQHGVCISSTYEVVACRNVLSLGKVNTSSYTTYTVQPGDTLSGIAEKYGVTVQQLQQWNDITNPNVIDVGQIIKIYNVGNGSSSSGTTNSNPQTSSQTQPSDTQGTVTTGMYGSIVSQGSCNIYSSPNNSSIIGTLEVGQRFYISSIEGNFYGISKPINGYIPINQTYVQTTPITTVSTNLINFTASWEGFSATPYQDSGGNWTVGYGHCTYGVKPAPETQAYAWQQLKDTLQSFADQLSSTYPYLNLAQWEFDAIVDFSFNLGFGSFQESDLLQDIQSCLSTGYIEGDFTAWDHCGYQVLQGLFRRRTAEYQMFLWREYNNN